MKIVKVGQRTPKYPLFRFPNCKQFAICALLFSIPLYIWIIFVSSFEGKLSYPTPPKYFNMFF